MKLRWITIRALLLVSAFTCPASAEEKAPTLTGLFPHGSSRGNTVTVTASGNLPAWPLKTWMAGEYEQDTTLSCKVLKDKGKLEISVPADAKPGIHWLRLYNSAGASSPRPFLVSDLPDVLEKEPDNSTAETLQLEKTGVMIHGRLEKKGDVDSIAVNLEANDVLVADLLANRVLASPMDGNLQITSPAGFVLAENDDDQGMDPKIVFRPPAPGRYIIRIFSFPAKPNSSIQFSGESSYIYRLALTTGPFIEYAYPLAAGLAEAAPVTLHGWNIPEDRKLIKLPAVEKGSYTIRIDGAANGAPLTREDCEILTEEEYASAGKLPKPLRTLLVSGRIALPGERDTFLFSSPDNKELEVSVEARGLGSLLDPVLTIKDSESKTVSEKDDTDGGLDCKAQFTAAANKTYHISVSDRFNHGSWRFFYLLRIAEPTRDFSLALGSDSFVLEKGKKLEIPVTIERHGGYDQKILITAADLPAGIHSTTAESIHGQDSAKAVKLILEGDSAPLGIPFRITGSAGGKGEPVHEAGYSVPGRKTPLRRAWLTVKGG